MKVTLKPYSRDKLQPAPAGVIPGATSFEISGLSGLLSKDATVRVTYSADDLSAAGGDPSKMKLAYYDTAKNAWTILPTQVNTQDMSLTTTTNHLSVWAVMISSPPATASTHNNTFPAFASLGTLSWLLLFLAVLPGTGNESRKKKFHFYSHMLLSPCCTRDTVHLSGAATATVEITARVSLIAYDIAATISPTARQILPG